jgi:N6-adenosine-specific RNA methylase IME4
MWPFGDLLPFCAELIVIDPAWDFATYSEKGETKGPRAQYATMSMDEIRALPVGNLARSNCLLLLWGTTPLIKQQIECLEGWGFVYKTCLAWNKVHPSGKPAIGTGYRARSMWEPVFVGTIGNPKHTAFPGKFDGVRREHSRKPESFYQLVDKHCPKLTARADLYVRTQRPGWMSYGDEATKFNDEAVA